MDETRKLLDSLMGQSRDQDFNEQQKNKGKNFMKDNVCKHYLLGFCPLQELGSSKMMMKRNIRDCGKIHSDALRKEFEDHPDHDKIAVDYERALLPCLEQLVREADSWVSRERSNVQRTELATPEKQTVNNMSPDIKEQHEQLTKDMNKLMSAAEEIAEKGDVDGSKFKVMLAQEIKSKIQELEEKYIVTYTITHKGEQVCEVCGTRTEAASTQNQQRYQAHFTGKVHLAYVKIREWVAKLRSRRSEPDGSERIRQKSRSRDRGREKRRSRSRGGNRDQTRSSRGGDERSRRDRSRSRRRRH
eukprot:TRINITY_DN67342_c0_g1_i1.p1 TRINITY_DN67342_c0_g1~~TRINITY_DN67342_c0_g1_i1.p1  ORF type:complete len:302 (-),score=48.45 TRINITY_DN67342_c0_g1_i1:33-938(-)